MPRFAAVLILTVLLFAGCGDDDETPTAAPEGASGATGATGASGAEQDGGADPNATADIDAISSCLDDAGLEPGEPEDVDLEGEPAQAITITAGDLPENGTVYVFESAGSAKKADDAIQLSINVFKETSGPVTAVLITSPSGSEGDEAKEAVSNCIAG